MSVRFLRRAKCWQHAGLMLGDCFVCRPKFNKRWDYIFSKAGTRYDYKFKGCHWSYLSHQCKIPKTCEMLAACWLNAGRLSGVSAQIQQTLCLHL